MAFRKSDSRPQILDVSPVAAIPGGEFQIRGKGLAGTDRTHVRFGPSAAPIVVSSESYVIARVPEGATGSELSVCPENGASDASNSASWNCYIGVQIADSVHPVANPVVDRNGLVYTTFSGPAGQKTAISVYKVEGANPQPFVTDIMNATGLALDREGDLYVSSRHDGVVYHISPEGRPVPYVEGMGVATGIVFDGEGNLYVGDRSGTIFKISPQRQIYVFATLEPSIAAYHLAFGPEGFLYVTGPTTSSFDSVARVSPNGHVERFFRGLGRPQGMAFDAQDNLYVAASFGGRRGVVRINPQAQAELFLSGPAIVGLAFTPSKGLILATNNISEGHWVGSLYRVNAGIEGRPLS